MNATSKLWCWGWQGFLVYNSTVTDRILSLLIQISGNCRGCDVLDFSHKLLPICTPNIIFVVIIWLFSLFGQLFACYNQYLTMKVEFWPLTALKLKNLPSSNTVSQIEIQTEYWFDHSFSGFHVGVDRFSRHTRSNSRLRLPQNYSARAGRIRENSKKRNVPESFHEMVS